MQHWTGHTDSVLWQTVTAVGLSFTLVGIGMALLGLYDLSKKLFHEPLLAGQKSLQRLLQLLAKKQVARYSTQERPFP